jgi:hypothetical protein
VQAQLRRRDPLDGRVQRVERLLEVGAPVVDIGAHRAEVVRHREVRRVQLQAETRVRDRSVLVAHRLGDRVDVGLVRGVVLVRVVEGDLAGRGRREERILRPAVAQ